MLFGVFYGVSEAKSRRKSELASSGKIFAWTSAHSCSECGPRYENYIPQKLRKVTPSCDCPHLRLTKPSSCGLLEAFLRPVLGDATVASRSTLAALPETGRGLRGWALLAPCPGWPAHAHCWRESLLLHASAPCSMLGSCPGSYCRQQRRPACCLRRHPTGPLTLLLWPTCCSCSRLLWRSRGLGHLQPCNTRRRGGMQWHAPWAPAAAALAHRPAVPALLCRTAAVGGITTR